MKILITFLVLISFVFGQDLPDAPSTTCTKNNGQPCAEWVHKLIGQYPPVKEHPSYPSWSETLTGKHAKLFWSTEGLAVAATVADIEVTHQGLAHHNCVEGNPDLPQHPTRGQLYRNNFEYLSPFLVGSFLLRKLRIPMAPYASPLVASGIHIEGAVEWIHCY